MPWSLLREILAPAEKHYYAVGALTLITWKSYRPSWKQPKENL